jgi:uncharacterized protein YutD
MIGFVRFKKVSNNEIEQYFAKTMTILRLIQKYVDVCCNFGTATFIVMKWNLHMNIKSKLFLRPNDTFIISVDSLFFEIVKGILFY